MFETRFCKVLGPDIKYLGHCCPFSGGPTKPTASATRILQTLTHSHYRNIAAVMLELDKLAQLLLVNKIVNLKVIVIRKFLDMVLCKLKKM